MFDAKVEQVVILVFTPNSSMTRNLAVAKRSLVS